MSQATMTSKGQITVPKDVRDELNLVAGSRVMFVRLGPRNYRLVARTGNLEDLFGILHRPGMKALTVEEENEAIAAAAAEGVMRSME